MAESDVVVYVYDLTKGLAPLMSSFIFGGGKQLQGIWHTSIVVYGEEYYYGSMGIRSCTPGTIAIGRPDNIISLGKTQIPREIFLVHLEELGSSTFRGSCYHLFDHNCNTFSNELANFLTGQSIPSEITNLPREIMETPMGSMIRQFIDTISHVSPDSPFDSPSWDGSSDRVNVIPESSAGSPTNVGGPGIPDSRKLNVGVSGNPAPSLATAGVPGSPFGNLTDVLSNLESTSKGIVETKIDHLPTGIDPPSAKTYVDKAVLTAYSEKRDVFHDTLRPNNFQYIEDVVDYFSNEQYSKSLLCNHLSLLCSLIVDSSMAIELRSISGRLLSLCMTNSGFIDICINDPKSSIQNLLDNFETFPDELLLATAKCLCNFFAERRVIKIIDEHSGHSGLGHNFVTTVVSFCKHSLLNLSIDLNVVASCITSAIVQCSNILKDEIFELGVALIEAVCSRNFPNESEEFVWYSLCVCLMTNHQLVDLAKVLGLDLTTEERKHPSIVKYTEKIRQYFV